MSFKRVENVPHTLIIPDYLCSSRYAVEIPRIRVKSFLQRIQIIRQSFLPARSNAMTGLRKMQLRYRLTPGSSASGALLNRRIV